MLQQLANPLDDRFTVDRRGGGFLEHFHQAHQPIQPLEHQFDHVAVDGQFVLSGGVEDIFDFMRELIDVLQPQHGRQPFEAVGRAEHLVEQRFVATLVLGLVQRADPLVQLEQVLVQSIQQLAGFVEEIAQEALEELVAGSDFGIVHLALPFIREGDGTATAQYARNP